MSSAIENPANCEVNSVIRFLLVKNLKVAEIHCELCSVCGWNVMSEGLCNNGAECFKMYKQMSRMRNKLAGRLFSLMNSLRKLKNKFVELLIHYITTFWTISYNFSYCFVQSHYTKIRLPEILLSLSPKISCKASESQRIGSALTFLLHYDAGRRIAG